MLANSPSPAAGLNEPRVALQGAPPRCDESLQLDSAPAFDAASLEALMRSNEAYQSRVSQLAAANDILQREVARQSRRLQIIMYELALAAERVGDRAFASLIRTLAAQPSDLSSVAACGLRSGTACTLHGALACPRCRALGVPQRLSIREREVLRLLTEGTRSPRIAEHLGISLATVEVHRRNIMRKLDLHTIAALTKYALREGLTSL